MERTYLDQYVFLLWPLGVSGNRGRNVLFDFLNRESEKQEDSFHDWLQHTLSSLFFHTVLNESLVTFKTPALSHRAIPQQMLVRLRKFERGNQVGSLFIILANGEQGCGGGGRSIDARADHSLLR